MTRYVLVGIFALLAVVLALVGRRPMRSWDSEITCYVGVLACTEIALFVVLRPIVLAYAGGGA